MRAVWVGRCTGRIVHVVRLDESEDRVAFRYADDGTSNEMPRPDFVDSYREPTEAERLALLEASLCCPAPI